jgi:hypothetical protein
MWKGVGAWRGPIDQLETAKRGHEAFNLAGR